MLRSAIFLCLCSVVFVGGLWLQPTTTLSAQQELCGDGPQFLAPMSPLLSDPTSYRQDMVNFVASVENFWQNNMVSISSIAWDSPCVLEYEPANVPFVEECGLTPEIATSNAFYCVPPHVVMWDGPTLYHPLYMELGDKSTLFIIAHEYGHAAQFVSGNVPQKSTNRELQADCYAGAYLQYAEAQGLLTEGDYEEVVKVVAAFGQSRVGTNWLTRTHGTSLQREMAMARGYQGGLTNCQVDFESLAEDGIERPIETIPTGESTITLPNGNEIMIIVPESRDSIEITGENDNTVTIPVPQGEFTPPVPPLEGTPCPPRLPRCR